MHQLLFVLVVSGKLYTGLWEEALKQIESQQKAYLSADCKQERILSCIVYCLVLINGEFNSNLIIIK